MQGVYDKYKIVLVFTSFSTCIFTDTNEIEYAQRRHSRRTLKACFFHSWETLVNTKELNKQLAVIKFIQIC